MADRSVATPVEPRGAVSEAVHDFHAQQLGWALTEAQERGSTYEERAAIIEHHLRQLHQEITHLIREDIRGLREPERVLVHEHAKALVAHYDEEERRLKR